MERDTSENYCKQNPVYAKLRYQQKKVEREYSMQSLKHEIKSFLENILHLRLSEEKTMFTHAKNEQANFLEYSISTMYPYRRYLRGYEQNHT